MKPTPQEARAELLMILAKAFRSYVTDPTPRADDHVYLEVLDNAIKRVEASESPKPVVGGRPDGGMLFPIGDAAS